MIRKATLEDIDLILNITKSCANHMINNNIYQWNTHYPNRIAFEIDIKRGELFVLEYNNKVIGSITISTLMDKEYIPIKWLTPNNNNIYIHRLCIHPNQQKKGFAKQLMAFAENYAIKNKYTSIRLDTFSKNASNQKFYELRNYKRLGIIYFSKQSIHPFYCYELVL